MGKSTKAKAGKGFTGTKASRYSPYGRDTTRITDLCDLLASSVSKIKSAPTMDDDEEPAQARVEEVEEQEENDSSGKMTRGKIQQRHKREWKELRAHLEDMKAHKKAIGAATLEKKNTKKMLAKEIKRMTDEMQERYKYMTYLAYIDAHCIIHSFIS
jgi:hypothetical protein